MVPPCNPPEFKELDAPALLWRLKTNTFINKIVFRTNISLAPSQLIQSQSSKPGLVKSHSMIEQECLCSEIQVRKKLICVSRECLRLFLLWNIKISRVAKKFFMSERQLLQNKIASKLASLSIVYTALIKKAFIFN